MSLYLIIKHLIVITRLYNTLWVISRDWTVLFSGFYSVRIQLQQLLFSVAVRAQIRGAHTVLCYY